MLSDPRPDTASGNYHLTIYQKRQKETMEALAAEKRPLNSKWVAFRYMTFSCLPHPQSEQV